MNKNEISFNRRNFRIEHIKKKAKEQSFPVVSADVLKSPGLLATDPAFYSVR